MDTATRTPTGAYTSARFPIDKVPESDWIVVGEVWSCDLTGDFSGEMIVTEIHYDGDDPNFRFHDPADYIIECDCGVSAAGQVPENAIQHTRH